MALVFSQLDEGQETASDGTMTTASLSPTDGAVLYVVVAQSTATGTGHVATFDVSGLSGTWAEVGKQEYPIDSSARRTLAVWRGTKATAWGTGSLTVTASNDLTLQDMAYLVDQVTGANAADPNDAAVTGAGSDNIALVDIGTVDAGDAVYVAGAHEDGANNFACTGYTEISRLGALTNIRQIASWFDDTTPDETPNLTSDGGSNAIGGIAFVVNVGAGGAVELLPKFSQRMNTLIRL